MLPACCVSEKQTVRGSMCVSLWICVGKYCAHVDVDCMYYADIGEPCAINKTGLQCAHWRNNLSDTMEKGSERGDGGDRQEHGGRERPAESEAGDDEERSQSRNCSE